MPAVKSAMALARTGDDRWLSQMTRCIFQAGFVWRVVDRKWDDFEEVFFGFPPEKILLLSPEQIDRFAQNPRIIRNRQKVLTVQANAHFVLDIAREHDVELDYVMLADTMAWATPMSISTSSTRAAVSFLPTV